MPGSSPSVFPDSLVRSPEKSHSQRTGLAFCQDDRKEVDVSFDLSFKEDPLSGGLPLFLFLVPYALWCGSEERLEELAEIAWRGESKIHGYFRYVQFRMFF